MPDRAPIDGPRKSSCSDRPAPPGLRTRSANVRPDAEPARDTKQFLSVGRKSSRLRRLDSRGSVHK
jgi:hypothetical protein